MEIKLFLAFVAPLVSLVAYIPYLKSIFTGTTRPHLYTWLIWSLSTATATAGMWYGGGGYATWGATAGAIFTFLFFLLSFKYGTKNITTSDTVVLILALVAIGLWWQLHQPLLAIILVSLIDISGYIPTYRKSWVDPWSEAVLPWAIWVLYGLCIFGALKNYNFLTTAFIVSTTICTNLILIAILLYRRRIVPKSAVSVRLDA